jgi:hypothetical protein
MTILIFTPRNTDDTDALAAAGYVHITRELDDTERDAEVGRMFEVRPLREPFINLKVDVFADELSNRPQDSLNDLMEIGHVVEILDNGLVIDAHGLHAPDVYLDATEAPEGWEFLDGYSAQDRYSGPHMADNESIGGRMEQDMRDAPGLYVAQVVTDLSADTDEGEDDHAGWVALRKL